jgi:hypothetical protein
MKLTNIIKESKTIQRENKGPCWDGYEQIGMKMKGGKEVPNCVPKNEVTELNDRKVYIDYLNKKKGFKQDRIKFNSYEDAVKWAKKNFEKFSPDMIKFESVNEATHTSQPGEWVGYIETPKGDKLMGRFKTARAAKMWLNKNNNKLLNTDGVTRVGIMGIDNWNKFHAKWAVENVNEANVNKKFGSKYDIGAGSMGNGTTFWNRAQEVRGDYKTIAHVSDNGKVTFYDKKLPNDVKKHIEDYAKTKTESVNENCGCGGVKISNPYSLSEFVIKENDYKLGDVEYTAKNMGPIDIMKLVFAYHQSSFNKLAGKNTDNKIRVARDLGRLLGKNPMNPNEKGKEPAWLLYPYKGKLVSTEEYKELYKGLFDKLKKMSNMLSRGARGGSDFSSSSAKAAAKADIQKYG